jgi:hypothetical protein
MKSQFLIKHDFFTKNRVKTAPRAGLAIYFFVNKSNYSGMLIGRSIAILYVLARKITAECAEVRESI